MARVRAPELLGRGGWIGATPDFGLAKLTGKVVVLDFWTSSCINCVRVQTELRAIEERFADEVVVIGVHSPKFPREHEHDAVERAVERLRIRHPVLDDPDLATWQQYGVKGWPTLVLIDPQGYVVGGIAGEGSGVVLTQSIEALLEEHRNTPSLLRGPVIGVWDTTAMVGFQSLSFPGKVAADPTGRRLVIADTGHDRVLVTDLAGRVELVVPHLHQPQGVRFDGNRLLVCDTGADRVVAVDRADGALTVLAHGLASPWDVAVLPDGSLLVAEAGRHRLWLVPADGEPRVVAGTGEENLLDTGAPEPGAGAPLLAQPSGVAALPDGGAVFVDAESSSLRALSPRRAVKTLVGQGLFDWGASDGGPDSSAMQHPAGVAVGGPGDGPVPTVFVADSLNHLIRAWTGTAWSAAAGRLRTLPVSGLQEPGGLDVLPDGRLVIADTNHHRVVVAGPDEVEATEILIDESWLGTALGAPFTVGPGGALSVPFDLDPGALSLDTSDGPPVRVEITADPSALLGPGPRRWELADPAGRLELAAGRPGDGIVVVTVEVAVCDDDSCRVLRSRRRHDLTVGPWGAAGPGDATAGRTVPTGPTAGPGAPDAGVPDPVAPTPGGPRREGTEGGVAGALAADVVPGGPTVGPA